MHTTIPARQARQLLTLALCVVFRGLTHGQSLTAADVLAPEGVPYSALAITDYIPWDTLAGSSVLWDYAWITVDSADDQTFTVIPLSDAPDADTYPAADRVGAAVLGVDAEGPQLAVDRQLRAGDEEQDQRDVERQQRLRGEHVEAGHGEVERGDRRERDQGDHAVGGEGLDQAALGLGAEFRQRPLLNDATGDQRGETQAERDGRGDDGHGAQDSDRRHARSTGRRPCVRPG